MQATYEIYDIGNGKKGYKIYIDGVLQIIQPHVPAVSGIRDMDAVLAKKLAECVCAKVNTGGSCAITKEDLKKMGMEH